MNAWEYFYYQYRDGSIPKELWVGADTYFRAHVEAEFAKKPTVETDGPDTD